MNDISLMAVVDAGEDLLHEDGAVSLAELATLEDLVEELATLADLSDKIVTLLILEELVHLDDVGVILSKDKTWLTSERSAAEMANYLESEGRKMMTRLTISFKILISLKSMRFSSSSMCDLRRTLTARWAPDSLCTHMRTSPNAPKNNVNERKVEHWDLTL